MMSVKRLVRVYMALMGLSRRGDIGCKMLIVPFRNNRTVFEDEKSLASHLSEAKIKILDHLFV